MHKANASLDMVYTNQLASAINLGSMKNYLGRARFAIDRAQFRPDAADVPQSLSKAEEFIHLADQEWQSYMALPLDPGERELARAVGASRDAYVNEGLQRVTRALLDKRPADAEQLIFNQLASRFVAFDNAWNKLQEYQLTLARERYDASQAFYDRFRTAFSLTLLLMAMFITSVSIVLLKAIMQPVAQAIHHFGHIAEGNLAEAIDIRRRDEMGALLQGLDRIDALLLRRALALQQAGQRTGGGIHVKFGDADFLQRPGQRAACVNQFEEGARGLGVFRHKVV